MPKKYGRSQTLVETSRQKERSFSVSLESITIIGVACLLVICSSLLLIWCRSRNFVTNKAKNDSNNVMMDVAENLEIKNEGIIVYQFSSESDLAIFSGYYRK